MDNRPIETRSCDLLVVGGGASGVSAAVNAAQAGLRTILLERYGFCGGGAVAGMSGTICGLYLATQNNDPKPEKVVFGFVDRFIETLEGLGGLSEPMQYGRTFTRVHDPDLWRVAADGLLRDAGAGVILHATVVGTLMDGDRVAGVRAWTKQGPLEVRATLTIDASGDAEVAAMAGFATSIGRDGAVQNPTMIFRLGNVDVDRFLAAYGTDTIMPPEVSEQIEKADASGAYRLPRRKIWLFPTTRPNELLCNCTRVIGADGRELLTLLMDDFTEAEIEGRRQARDYARFFRDTLAGCEASYVIDTPPQVGVRQTRQIVGRKTLSNDDVVTGRKCRDGIAVSPWPIELHAGERPKVEWLFEDTYEVPLGCFVPEEGNGLLMAGRCLSAEHEAVASARVTAQCFAYGQAAAKAAEMAIRDHRQPAEVDGAEVRAALNADGARIGH